MGSQQLLLDFHERCHRSLQRYLEHCRVLSDEELDRELEGFGYPTARLQLHHVIGAERYWVSVLRGEMDASEDEADAASIDALERFRQSVFEMTRSWLGETPEEKLIAARTVTTFGGHERSLAPVHVILRTQTHLFHHMGQIAAMCRLLGHPIPEGMDFPIL
ncbi:MAG: DinB family protein [Planctomycetota bacterium]